MHTLLIYFGGLLLLAIACATSIDDDLIVYVIAFLMLGIPLSMIYWGIVGW